MGVKRKNANLPHNALQLTIKHHQMKENILIRKETGEKCLIPNTTKLTARGNLSISFRT